MVIGDIVGMKKLMFMDSWIKWRRGGVIRGGIGGGCVCKMGGREYNTNI